MKVFLSHADSDEHLARRMATRFREVGLDVWDRTRDILPGDDWAALVSHALQESEAMVVLLTPDAMRSSFVRAEIDYALGHRRFRQRLVPVLVGNPEELKTENIPWILARLKPVRIREHENEQEAINEIAATLRVA